MSRAAIEIEAPDGSMPAFSCTPDGAGPFPGVLVLMEAFGLNAHIRDVTARFAEAGYAALAPDLYYRTPGTVIDYRDLDRAIELLRRTNALGDAPEERAKDDRVVADIGAALRGLSDREDVDSDRVAVVGFCMGGRLAWLTACRHPQAVRSGVCFYGGRIAASLHEAHALEAPLLLLFGEKDASIPLEQVRRIEEELGQLGKRFELEVYPGAGHGFFCDERDSYDPAAAAAAWQRALDWLGR